MYLSNRTSGNGTKGVAPKSELVQILNVDCIWKNLILGRKLHRVGVTIEPPFEDIWPSS